MKKNTILLQEITATQLATLLSDSVDTKLQKFTSEFLRQQAKEDIFTRDQACEFLQISPSTLWHWCQKGIVKSYTISNKRFYKRSELLQCLKPVKQ
ncbi:helix-turn-helix domain-containing protein [Croceibacter atlanticus]|uniref:helix-turn-helix domain-containing protein n=1 Tax=Croceibacter atlanticus TaxID=313588 RepID=UPI0030DDCDFE|tara:strand:+ start:155429 stop:155716 length:288 start_codon:yes stop_codon:yes gene_type:complete